MRCLFLTFSNPEEKAGLFYSTHERITHTITVLDDYKVINIRFYDNWILETIKKSIGIKRKRVKPDFIYEKIKYENIYLKRGVLSSVTPWGKLEKCRITEFLCNEKFLRSETIKSIEKIAKDYDYIMAHWGYPIGRIAMRISECVNIPYYVTYHGSDLNVLPNQNKFLHKAIKETMNNASMNFMVSQALYITAIKLYGNVKAHVSHNGINKVIIRRTNLRLTNYTEKILFIGNLNDDKRADLLPDIIKDIVKKTNKMVHFIIIGNGKYKDFINRSLKDSQLPCTLIGHISHDEVLMHLNDATMLILPSRREGLPLVILEAIATDTIPVASRVGGISELLEEAFLVDESESFVNDFADKVVQLLDNPRYPALELEMYTWTHIIRKEMGIIKRINNAQ